MKCAKCGHDVDPSSPNCPYCASGASQTKQKRRSKAICPECGSDNVEESVEWWMEATRLPGCQGAVLQLALRMWMWIIGVSPYHNSCLDCGHRWKSRGDIVPLLILILAGVLIAAAIAALVMLVF